MPLVQGAGDIAVYTIDTVDHRALIKNVNYRTNLTKADVGRITRPGIRRQTVKKSVEISTGHMSQLASDSGLMASNLAIGGFTIGGTSYLAYLRGGSFSGSFETRETSGVADVFTHPQHFGKDYAATVNLMIPLTGSPNALRNLSPGVYDTDLLDQDLVNVAFSITIDGSAVTVPMQIETLEIAFTERQEIAVTIQLVGNDPGTGDFPTSPTGTTTMLEKCFNAYNAPIAIVLTSASGTDGVIYSGNFIPGPFSFQFNDAEIIMLDFTWLSRGTITATLGT